MKVHHYDVYLRTSRGTLRRRVGITERNVKRAANTALADVQRILKRERLEVIDCVPLQMIVGSDAKVIKRGRRPVVSRSVEFKRTRRPKARESVRLTPKGKLASVRDDEALDAIRAIRDPGERARAVAAYVLETHVPASEKLGEKGPGLEAIRFSSGMHLPALEGRRDSLQRDRKPKVVKSKLDPEVFSKREGLMIGTLVTFGGLRAEVVRLRPFQVQIKQGPFRGEIVPCKRADIKRGW